jgi:proteasome component ECM29
MEILSHVNKMVKQRPTLQLPVEALLAQFESSDVPEPIKNFSKIYLCTGWARIDREKQVNLARSALRALPGRSSAQAVPVLLLTLPVIGEVAPEGDPADVEGRLAAVGLDKPAARAVMLGVLCDVMLLVNSDRQATQPVDAGSTRLPPPPGALSRARLHRLVGKSGDANGFDSEAKLVQIKRGIVRFLSSYAPELGLAAFPHLVVGSADGHHSVASEAATAFKRLVSKSDYNRPEVAGHLVRLLIGTPVALKGVPPDTRVAPAGHALRQVLLSHLLRSNTAASTCVWNQAPHTPLRFSSNITHTTPHHTTPHHTTPHHRTSHASVNTTLWILLLLRPLSYAYERALF